MKTMPFTSPLSFMVSKDTFAAAATDSGNDTDTGDPASWGCR